MQQVETQGPGCYVALYWTAIYWESMVSVPAWFTIQLKHHQTSSVGNGAVFYLWLSKVFAIERRRYVCNVFSHWLTPCTATNRNRALDINKKCMVKIRSIFARKVNNLNRSVSRPCLQLWWYDNEPLYHAYSHQYRQNPELWKALFMTYCKLNLGLSGRNQLETQISHRRWIVVGKSPINHAMRYRKRASIGPTLAVANPVIACCVMWNLQTWLS